MNVSTDRTVTRAKYLSDTPVDAKSIAMLMIKKMNHKWARSLCEFAMTRVAIGRGGEMAFVRWNEGAYDHYFQGADFDWNIIKQLDKQCMLMYCDLELYWGICVVSLCLYIISLFFWVWLDTRLNSTKLM